MFKKKKKEEPIEDHFAFIIAIARIMGIEPRALLNASADRKEQEKYMMEMMASAADLLREEVEKDELLG